MSARRLHRPVDGEGSSSFRLTLDLRMGKKQKFNDIAAKSRKCCCKCHEMADRDPRRQRRRIRGARLSDADSHSPEAVGVGDPTYGSPVRVPLTGADSTSFMPTPWVDAYEGQKYWEGPNFQKISAQNKKNRSSDPEGMGPSLHTCGSIPMTERRRRLAVSFQREPTVDELYKDTHMHKNKDNQGNWVCKKSELRLEEHRNRWQEYRSSHSTDDSSQSPPLSKHDIWVQGNLTSNGHVYGFGAEGVLMKQRSRLLVSSRSSSVNNYDAHELAMRLNESAFKAAEEARQSEEARQKEIQDFRKQVEEKEAKFQHELAQEKAARQRDKEKVKSKLSKLWKFFKSQQAGSSTAQAEDDDDDEDEPDPSHLGDSSDE